MGLAASNTLLLSARVSTGWLLDCRPWIARVDRVGKLSIRQFLSYGNLQFLRVSGWTVDLPNLSSIQLGGGSLMGENEDDCSLILQGSPFLSGLRLDLPKLTSITSFRDSFIDPRRVVIASLDSSRWRIRSASAQSYSPAEFWEESSVLESEIHDYLQ